MALVSKDKLIKENELQVNQVDIQNGSGAFLVDSGPGHEGQSIKVYYHKPENFHEDSKILIVIPGAGRNGDSYRDAWIEESEKYGLLILSPMYNEREYGFGDYHLCGLLKNIELKNSIEYVENTNIARMNEENFKFEINPNREQWIFNDFDRIFDMVIAHLNSKQTTYDIFGHSAGGHILHRMALFQKDSKVNHIMPANSSFYTLPSFEYSMPFGLKDAPIERESLKQAFGRNFVLFLGEMDNENETGGTFLRSTTADKQGLHRLSRGKFFFDTARAIAEELKVEFNWKIQIVPGVGHNHREMGNAVGEYLYANK
ncbi:hypothetical protein GTQ38_09165 [Flavobacteriaceae bacterium R33]|uniref:Alpha/beta hydrolase n=2 Tax=Poritiphilus flavus TaxID=2697053 RepID=A0A6L9ECP6_9FLAO|nr:hypothetical protein [Poritiphilus flavus]